MGKQKSMGQENFCAGIRSSGHWNGYPCGATPTHYYRGNWYCKNHHPYLEIAEHERRKRATGRE